MYLAGIPRQPQAEGLEMPVTASNGSLSLPATAVVCPAVSSTPGASVVSSLNRAHSCDSLEGAAPTGVSSSPAGLVVRTGSDSHLSASHSDAPPLPPPPPVRPPQPSLQRRSQEDVTGVLDELVSRVSTSETDGICDSARTPSPPTEETPPTEVSCVDRSMDLLDLCESFSVCPAGAADPDNCRKSPPSSVDDLGPCPAAPRGHMDTSTSEISDSLVTRPKVTKTATAASISTSLIFES